VPKQALYQVWIHRSSGEVYVVWLGANSPHRGAPGVIGIYGPLDPLDVGEADSAGEYPFDCGPAAQAIAARQAEFTLHMLRPSRRALPGVRSPQAA
jgi:hypothetical protein